MQKSDSSISGYLYRRGNDGTSWTNRYVALSTDTGTIKLYAEKSGKRTLKTNINIKKGKWQDLEVTTASRPFAFEITVEELVGKSEDAVMIFAANNKDELKAWNDAILSCFTLGETRRRKSIIVAASQNYPGIPTSLATVNNDQLTPSPSPALASPLPIEQPAPVKAVATPDPSLPAENLGPVEAVAKPTPTLPVEQPAPVKVIAPVEPTSNPPTLPVDTSEGKISGRSSSGSSQRKSGDHSHAVSELLEGSGSGELLAAKLVAPIVTETNPSTLAVKDPYSPSVVHKASSAPDICLSVSPRRDSKFAFEVEDNINNMLINRLPSKRNLLSDVSSVKADEEQTPSEGAVQESETKSPSKPTRQPRSKDVDPAKDVQNFAQLLEEELSITAAVTEGKMITGKDDRRYSSSTLDVSEDDYTNIRTIIPEDFSNTLPPMVVQGDDASAETGSQSADTRSRADSRDFDAEGYQNKDTASNNSDARSSRSHTTGKNYKVPTFKNILSPKAAGANELACAAKSKDVDKAPEPKKNAKVRAFDPADLKISVIPTEPVRMGYLFKLDTSSRELGEESWIHQFVSLDINSGSLQYFAELGGKRLLRGKINIFESAVKTLDYVYYGKMFVFKIITRDSTKNEKSTSVFAAEEMESLAYWLIAFKDCKNMKEKAIAAAKKAAAEQAEQEKRMKEMQAQAEATQTKDLAPTEKLMLEISPEENKDLTDAETDLGFIQHSSSPLHEMEIKRSFSRTSHEYPSLPGSASSRTKEPVSAAGELTLSHSSSCANKIAMMQVFEPVVEVNETNLDELFKCQTITPAFNGPISSQCNEDATHALTRTSSRNMRRTNSLRMETFNNSKDTLVLNLNLTNVSYPTERLARRVKVWYCSSGFSLVSEADIERFVNGLKGSSDLVIRGFADEKFEQIKEWITLLQQLRKYEMKGNAIFPANAGPTTNMVLATESNVNNARQEDRSKRSIVFNVNISLPSRSDQTASFQLSDEFDLLEISNHLSDIFQMPEFSFRSRLPSLLSAVSNVWAEGLRVLKEDLLFTEDLVLYQEETMEAMWLNLNLLKASIEQKDEVINQLYIELSELQDIVRTNYTSQNFGVYSPMFASTPKTPQLTQAHQHSHRELLAIADREFNLADRDGDGRISRDEWRKYMQDKHHMIAEHAQVKATLLAEIRNLRKAMTPSTEQIYFDLKKSEDARQKQEEELIELHITKDNLKNENDELKSRINEIETEKKMVESDWSERYDSLLKQFQEMQEQLKHQLVQNEALKEDNQQLKKTLLQTPIPPPPPTLSSSSNRGASEMKDNAPYLYQAVEDHSLGLDTRHLIEDQQLPRDNSLSEPTNLFTLAAILNASDVLSPPKEDLRPRPSPFRGQYVPTPKTTESYFPTAQPSTMLDAESQEAGSSKEPSFRMSSAPHPSLIDPTLTSPFKYAYRADTFGPSSGYQTTPSYALPSSNNTQQPPQPSISLRNPTSSEMVSAFSDSSLSQMLQQDTSIMPNSFVSPSRDPTSYNSSNSLPVANTSSRSNPIAPFSPLGGEAASEHPLRVSLRQEQVKLRSRPPIPTHGQSHLMSNIKTPKRTPRSGSAKLENGMGESAHTVTTQPQVPTSDILPPTPVSARMESPISRTKTVGSPVASANNTPGRTASPNRFMQTTDSWNKRIMEKNPTNGNANEPAREPAIWR